MRACGGVAWQRIVEQQAFVAWWDATVTPGSAEAGPGRGKKGVTERGHLLAKDATAQTGISKQQVSRWRGRLADEIAVTAGVTTVARR
jgi:hypothetical protein